MQVVGQLFSERNVISDITAELKLVADIEEESPPAKLEALPNFSPLKMNDYFFRFVKNVTVLVDLTEFITKVISFEDPKLSLLIGLLGTLFIATI